MSTGLRVTYSATYSLSPDDAPPVKKRKTEASADGEDANGDAKEANGDADDDDADADADAGADDAPAKSAVKATEAPTDEKEVEAAEVAAGDKD